MRTATSGKKPIALERRGRLEPHLTEFVGHAGIGEDARLPRSARRCRARRRPAARRWSRPAASPGAAPGRRSRGSRGGGARPRRGRAPRRRRARPGLRRASTPSTSARHSAVRSSCVVPRPPPTTSRSGSPPSACRRAGDQALAVVGDGEEFRDLDAPPAEVVADEGPVGVPRAAVQQFVAAEDHGGARRSRRHQSLVPGMRMTSASVHEVAHPLARVTTTTTTARTHWMMTATSVETWMNSAMSAVGKST